MEPQNTFRVRSETLEKDGLFYLKLRWISSKDDSDRKEFGDRIRSLLNMPTSARLVRCTTCARDDYYVCDYCDQCPQCCNCSADTDPDWTLAGD